MPGHVEHGVAGLALPFAASASESCGPPSQTTRTRAGAHHERHGRHQYRRARLERGAREPTGAHAPARTHWRSTLPLCTRTIEKALGRLPGVDKVAVSLSHEQALVEFDPTATRPEELLGTLRAIGYTISDPRKLRPFEEEERALVEEGRRFLIATALSAVSIGLITRPTGIGAWLLPAVVFASLLAFVFLVLRVRGLLAAVAGCTVLTLAGLGVIPLRSQPGSRLHCPGSWRPWPIVLVFGIGRHILMMAYQALRRGILNQRFCRDRGELIRSADEV